MPVLQSVNETGESRAPRGIGIDVRTTWVKAKHLLDKERVRGRHKAPTTGSCRISDSFAGKAGGMVYSHETGQKVFLGQPRPSNLRFGIFIADPPLRLLSALCIACHTENSESLKRGESTENAIHIEPHPFHIFLILACPVVAFISAWLDMEIHMTPYF